MFTLHELLKPTRRVSAHCDLPCGIYDPDQARIEAESCLRILEKYAASDDDAFRDRCLIIKEQRADLVKHHLDELWHDYFKPQHVERFPNLHQVFWEAGKQASEVKATTDVGPAHRLLETIEQIDEMWAATGGRESTRIARPGTAAH